MARFRGSPERLLATYETQLLFFTSAVVALAVPAFHFLPPPFPGFRDPVEARVFVTAVAIAVGLLGTFVPATRRRFNLLQACTIVAASTFTGALMVMAHYDLTYVIFEVFTILALGYTFTDYLTLPLCAIVGFAAPLVAGWQFGVAFQGSVVRFTIGLATAWLIAIAANYVRVRWVRYFVLRRTTDQTLLEGRGRDDAALALISRTALESTQMGVTGFLTNACSAVAQRLGARRVAIYRCDDSAQSLSVWTSVGWPDGGAPAAPIELLHSVGDAITTARGKSSGPLALKVDLCDERLAAIAVCTPFPEGREPVGVIAVFDQPGFVFEAERAPFLCAVARVAGDVVENDKVTRELRSANHRLAEAQDLARAGDWIRESGSGRAQWSEQLYRILDVDPAVAAERLYETYVERMHPEDREMVLKRIDSAIAANDNVSIDHRIVKRSGEVRWVNLRSGPHESEIGVRAGVVLDITERKLIEETMERLAAYDELTSLPNRSKLRELLYEANANAGGGGTTLFFFDVDRFKRINDSLGHVAGDRLLVAVATRLMLLDYSDRAGIIRWGGDEFAVIFPGADVERATRLATRLVTELAAPYEIDDRELTITVSVGVALSPSGSVGAVDLMRNADTAMYVAKDAGGNRFELFSEAMYVTTTQRLSVETSLRAALAADEFELHFQPIVAAKTREIVGAEALLRHHSKHTTAELIYAAEETGLMPALGEWVLDRAYDQIAAWAGRGLRLYVNISVLQLRDPGFLERMERRIAQRPHLRNLVVFELTESALVGEEMTNHRVVEQLRQFGAGVAIDDFGTGYSSLAYLRRLPATHLKLDRAFTSDIAQSPTDRAIVRAVVEVAHTIGLDVTAEGIETREQWRELEALGVDQIQGWLFCEALTASTFERRFFDRPTLQAVADP